MNSSNSNSSRALSIVVAALLALLVLAGIYKAEAHWGAALLAAFGGIFLAQAIIFARPDLLKSEELPS